MLTNLEMGDYRGFYICLLMSMRREFARGSIVTSMLENLLFHYYFYVVEDTREDERVGVRGRVTYIVMHDKQRRPCHSRYADKGDLKVMIGLYESCRCSVLWSMFP